MKTSKPLAIGDIIAKDGKAFVVIEGNELSGYGLADFDMGRMEIVEGSGSWWYSSEGYTIVRHANRNMTLAAMQHMVSIADMETEGED